MNPLLSGDMMMNNGWYCCLLTNVTQVFSSHTRIDRIIKRAELSVGVCDTDRSRASCIGDVISHVITLTGHVVSDYVR